MLLRKSLQNEPGKGSCSPRLSSYPTPVVTLDGITVFMPLFAFERGECILF